MPTRARVRALRQVCAKSVEYGNTREMTGNKSLLFVSPENRFATTSSPFCACLPGVINSARHTREALSLAATLNLACLVSGVRATPLFIVSAWSPDVHIEHCRHVAMLALALVYTRWAVGLMASRLG